MRWQGLRYLFAPCSGLAIRRLAMVYAHANRALTLSGLPPLAPAMGWEYVKVASAARGKRPVSFLAEAVVAIVTS